MFDYFKDFTLTWWQASIFKITLTSGGVLLGIYFTKFFKKLIPLLWIIFVIGIIYLSSVWLKQPTPINKPAISTSSIDYSCSVESDCTYKSVGDVCQTMRCVNKNFVPKPITPQKGIYNCPAIFLPIDGCRCINQTCKMVQNGQVLQ